MWGDRILGNVVLPPPHLIDSPFDPLRKNNQCHELRWGGLLKSHIYAMTLVWRHWTAVKPEVRWRRWVALKTFIARDGRNCQVSVKTNLGSAFKKTSAFYQRTWWICSIIYTITYLILDLAVVQQEPSSCHQLCGFYSPSCCTHLVQCDLNQLDIIYMFHLHCILWLKPEKKKETEE